MKYFLFLLGIILSGFAQNQLHHQMLSAQGATKILSNGTYVSQTIRQQSVIGNYAQDGKTYGQGYPQSVWCKYIQNTIKSDNDGCLSQSIH